MSMIDGHVKSAERKKKKYVGEILIVCNLHQTLCLKSECIYFFILFLIFFLYIYITTLEVRAPGPEAIGPGT